MGPLHQVLAGIGSFSAAGVLSEWSKALLWVAQHDACGLVPDLLVWEPSGSKTTVDWSLAAPGSPGMLC